MMNGGREGGINKINFLSYKYSTMARLFHYRYIPFPWKSCDNPAPVPGLCRLISQNCSRTLNHLARYSRVDLHTSHTKNPCLFYLPSFCFPVPEKRGLSLVRHFRPAAHDTLPWRSGMSGFSM
jgi:hypothetical protein